MRRSAICSVSTAWLLVVCLFIATAAPTGAAGTRVNEVDWHNALFVVPAFGPCHEQEVQFADGDGYTEAHLYSFVSDLEVRDGDVTDDGAADAVMALHCGVHHEDPVMGLVAIATDGDEDHRPIGTVIDPATTTQEVVDFTVWYGDIAVTLADRHRPHDFWTEYYRWSAEDESFVRIDS